MQTRGGRWLYVLDAATDHNDLEHLLLPCAWTLLTTRRPSLLQPLGLEAWDYPVRFFTEDESVQAVERRMGSQWDKYNDSRYAKRVHALGGGWPIAVGLAASIARLRGWSYLLRRLSDPARALTALRVDRGNTSETSMKMALAETLRDLSPDARALICQLSGQATNAVEDYEAALIELCELGLAERTPTGANLQQLLTLYIAETAEYPCAS